MVLSCISPGDMGNVDCSFMVITLRSTLNQNRCNCYYPTNGSNNIVQTFTKEQCY